LRGRSSLLAALFALLWLPYAGAAQDAAPQDSGTGTGTDAGAGADSAKSAVIYVVRRAWHTDIGFAAADLQPPLNAVAAQFPQVRYLFFGFGDQHYLLAKDGNAPVSLGVIWPGRGLILATALASSPQAAFGAAHVATLFVTQKQARDTQAFVWRSLDKQSAEQGSGGNGIEPYAAGPYEGSLYFAATPRYSAFHTCITWAAESLRAAALPIHSAGVIFAGQLWTQVRRLEKKQSADGLRGEGAQSHNAAVQAYRLADHSHGGRVPSWHTTVVPPPEF
jgi:Protein of unknown function (DUF2459)